jgi:type II secretory pathway pseudopilin PulG
MPKSQTMNSALTLKQKTRRQQSGFTVTELIIACAIVMTLVAIAIPSLTGSKKAVSERLGTARLASAGAAQSTFRAALGKRRYGTLAELRSANLSGAPLLQDAVDASGNTVPNSGWYLTPLEAPTATTFGIALKSTDSSATRSYCIFEDQTMRRVESGACSRISPVVTND